MKFLGISFNISELISKIIFRQFSRLQLWRHITFICISRWRPPYHKFLSFECKYLENQKWCRKTVSHVLFYFIRSSWRFFRFSLWKFLGFLPQRSTCYTCIRGCVYGRFNSNPKIWIHWKFCTQKYWYHAYLLPKIWVTIFMGQHKQFPV